VDVDTREALGTALAGEQPRLLVLAGPNGAGKTTFYEQFLTHLSLPFVNADQMARALNPDDAGSVAFQAAELADQLRRELLGRRVSFIMETVFSDPAGDKLGFLRDAQAAGYRVILLFIGLDASELSVLRVTQRALEGGHDVPLDKLHERFPRTLRNLDTAVRFVDVALLFDNSSIIEPFRHLSTWRNGDAVFRDPAAPDWCPLRHD
jgi:predicted ABC-type ATPase